MKLFKKIAIVGVGLIGGSMGLAIKKKRLCNEVIGISFHKNSITLAKKRGAIDTGAQDIRVIKDADLVILATPVKTILKLAPQLSKIIRKNCLVSDVGSTKKEIVAKLERLFPNYIGGHPLTGSEKKGIDFASSELFKNSIVLLTPTSNTRPFVRVRLKQLWTELGAKVIFISPATHDRILSLVSHLPHIAAFSLIGAIPLNYLQFASTGLKDTTRIASSAVELWTDIFLTNQKNVLKAIDAFQLNLSRIKSAIKKNERKKLERFLKEAKKKRDRLQ